MRSVYEASSAVQAHLLQDVLRQQGIASHVQGEHLQGAIGELPAGTLVRLLVDDADYHAARRTLDDWESAAPMDEEELASYDHSLPASAGPATAPSTTALPTQQTAYQTSQWLAWLVGIAVVAFFLYGLVFNP
ncbi:MAG: DUF2007 domain-containing protein [Comamonas sp.]